MEEFRDVSKKFGWDGYSVEQINTGISYMGVG